jgi:hypothetical protein
MKIPKPKPPAADSPLPAWQHIEITRFAELAVLKKLPNQPTQMEFLIGLEVHYFVSQEENGEETNYSMPVGKVLLTLNETDTGKSHIRREFLDKIYNEVDAYVRKNVQPPYLVTNVILQVRTNLALYNISCPCLSIGGKYWGKPVRCYGRDLRGSMCKCCWNSTSREWVCNHRQCGR